jgi:hypothetical protein
MTDASLTSPALPGAWRIAPQKYVNACFFLLMVSSSIAFVEPSPYDFVSLIAMPLWFICGFKVYRGFVPYFLLLTVYLLAGFIALVPYWNEPDPVMFEIQSLYLYITALFFGLFFAERTLERAELCLKAFTTACLLGAITGIIGYFDLFGTGLVFATYGRAAGTFKDPNVFGSFEIMGALYCMQLIILRRTRHYFITGAVLAVILAGILFSFSRGSYGTLIMMSALMVGMAFVATPSARIRRQILIGVLIAIGLAAVLLIALMSVDSIRELLTQRTQAVGEEYQDPRFENQMRSLPMLLERPLGFGPLRFRLIFDLEPHSSYVNAFASYGWLGGFSFILLVGVTIFIGFRLCFALSPFRTLAQVFFPALMGFFLQGFQIDIDHWRHVYLMLGAIWGMEAARQHWLATQARA